jgi:hypothetical protein
MFIGMAGELGNTSFPWARLARLLTRSPRPCQAPTLVPLCALREGERQHTRAPAEGPAPAWLQQCGRLPHPGCACVMRCRIIALRG